MISFCKTLKNSDILIALFCGLFEMTGQQHYLWKSEWICGFLCYILLLFTISNIYKPASDSRMWFSQRVVHSQEFISCGFMSGFITPQVLRPPPTQKAMVTTLYKNRLLQETWAQKLLEVSISEIMVSVAWVIIFNDNADKQCFLYFLERSNEL